MADDDVWNITENMFRKPKSVVFLERISIPCWKKLDNYFGFDFGFTNLRFAIGWVV